MSYRLSAPEVDWTETERLVVAYRQRWSRATDAGAGPDSWETVVLDGAYRAREIQVEGACAPDLELVRTFVSRWRDGLGRPLVCRSAVERVRVREVVLAPGTGRPCSG
ncbi:MAG TPA: hypothetical protein RMH99_11795 [Sandaracinaceae bacterium LLY-WYZ-13_1]|nr:hypothetical protein [Sandaracinaceae bacterium LLY-WYZ-13_1]